MKPTVYFQQRLDLTPPPWKIGQVVIQSGYFLTHVDDQESSQLRLVADLNDWREILKSNACGESRPLKAAPDLQRGWKFGPLNFSDLFIAVEYLYPAAIANASLFEENELEVTPYRETADRQTGRYAITKTLEPGTLTELQNEICTADCLKQRLWSDSPVAKNVSPSAEFPLLCPEACNYFISKARDKIKGDPENDPLE